MADFSDSYKSAAKAKIPLDAVSSPRFLFGDLSLVEANRYPQASYANLREALSEYSGWSASGITAGNGSDELIAYLILKYGNGGVALYEPTFPMYSINCRNFGKPVVSLQLDSNFQPVICDEARNASLVFICSPNNPTGTQVSQETILQFAKECKGVVVVDEAYFEFCNISFINRLSEFENVAILRSLSKAWGLAGLRIGYMLANERITSEIGTMRLPFNISALSEKLAADAITIGKSRMMANVEQIVQERNKLSSQLANRGYSVFPSSANFVLVRCPYGAKATICALAKDGIAVKDFSDALGLGDCVRISAGSSDEISLLLGSLDRLAANGIQIKV